MSRRLSALALAGVLALGACTGGEEPEPTTSTSAPVETTVPEAAEPELYLMLMWHQHQPFYPLDDDGNVTRPWVRVHATKDYVDMATTVAAYPDVHVTFNLTPVLLTQIQDFLDGVRDLYWVHTEVPASELSDEQKAFVLRRFFDTNEAIVARFPRYAALAEIRSAAGGADAPVDTFTTDDYRDLQVLWNLAWTDPDFLAEEPLASLVAKAEGFTEEDKTTLLAEHERIVGLVFDAHADLWDAGQIEVTTTPLAHPILPLLIDSGTAVLGDPSAVLPANRFSHPDDAALQVVRGIDLAEELLGRRPVGMWPGEGAVSQLAASVMAREGVEWIATGEPVLAASLGLGESFPRGEGDVPDDAAELYRPHAATFSNSDPLPVFFRDLRLSDLVGFEYSGTDGQVAADDFIGRLEAIKDTLGPSPDGTPWVVSVILDGENAWEHYPNDGKEFLNALYAGLSDTPWLETITPSAYLERHGEPEPLPGDVFPGSWFQASYATWIGEDEEATAWDYLYEAREAISNAERRGVDEETLAAAMEPMLFAEGSDWFWWYGADQSSGDDGYFDRAYRAWLRRVYEALGDEVPASVGIPIIPATPVAPDQEPSGEAVSPTIDGTVLNDEWAGATVHDLDGTLFLAGFDADKLSLALPAPSEPVRVALGVPSADAYRGDSPDGDEVGFGVTHELFISPTSEAPGYVACLIAIDGGSCFGSEAEEGVVSLDEFAVGLGEMEISIPTDALGTLEPGDRVAFRWLEPTLLPASAPGAIQVPDVSNVEIRFEADDPFGDDTGTGSYTYATDGVFAPGSFDLTRFTAGVEGEDVVFSFEVDAAIRNPWGSPVGLSIQTFDLYIDIDPGTATGSRLFIDGRNVALQPEDGWEAALTIEGWDSALYLAATDGTAEETKPTLGIVTLAEKGKVLVRVPADLLPAGDPAEWGYAVAVLGQEGFPSGGVRRVRDVNPTAEQWRFGGAPADSINHTRVMDLLLPDEGGVQGSLGEQARFLAEIPPYEGTQAEIAADDVALVPLVVAP